MPFDPTNFNPEAFLEMPVEGTFEKRPPLPLQSYTAEIKGVNARAWKSKDKVNEDGTYKAGVSMDIELLLSIPEEVQTRLGLKMPTFTIKDGLMLDLNESGGYDFSPGRNRQLREYREATDMNKPGVTFRPKELIGRIVTVMLKYEDYNGTPQERIAAVARG